MHIFSLFVSQPFSLGLNRLSNPLPKLRGCWRPRSEGTQQSHPLCMRTPWIWEMSKAARLMVRRQSFRLGLLDLRFAQVVLPRFSHFPNIRREKNRRKFERNFSKLLCAKRFNGLRHRIHEKEKSNCKIGLEISQVGAVSRCRRSSF